MAGEQDRTIEAYPTKELFISMLIKDIPLVRAIIDLVDNCVDTPESPMAVFPAFSPPVVAGFIRFGRLATPTLCNEAEPGSLSLRLANLPCKAS